MPYMTKTNESSGEICVYKKGADGEPEGDTLGCHHSQEKADAQIAAIGASTHAEAEVTEEYVRIRAKDPGLFQEDSFRTIVLDEEGGIKAIIGRLEGETSTTTQAYLFAKEKWDTAKAEEWVADHQPKADVKELKLAEVTFGELLEMLRAHTLVEPITPAEEIVMAESGQTAMHMAETGHVVEAKALSPDNPQGPVRLVIEPIQPGWGNRRDKHYYPAPMLKEYANVLVGAHMFLTDHKTDEHVERNKVSITEELVGFSDTGAPRLSAVVYDPYTAQKVRNMAEAGVLHALDFSIYAEGKSRKGTIDGQQADIVEAIERDPKPIIDWVSTAGAGGRAVGIMEAEPKEPEKETVMLEGEAVRTLLREKCPELPDAALIRLAKGQYADAPAVEKALASEVAYLKEVTKSGQPFDMGTAKPVAGKRMTIEEYQAELDAIDERHGLRPARI